VTTASNRLVLITGLSGSGKSSVANCFEDLGYYVVDNLPLSLLEALVHDPAAHLEGHDRIAIVTDVRAPGFADRFPPILEQIDRHAIDLTLLFLESSDESLVRRFSETRRPHPLAGDRSPIEGIRRERALLIEVRGSADMVLDSSEWSVHEMRSHIYRHFAGEPGEEASMAVSVSSFGFKYGIPYGTDLLFDVRFLPNPHFVPGLREQTGRDQAVTQYLDEQEDFQIITEKLQDLLLYLLPKYRKENRSYVSIAIGCTGGRHRSVALCERLGKELSAADWQVRVSHRDINKKQPAPPSTP